MLTMTISTYFRFYLAFFNMILVLVADLLSKYGIRNSVLLKASQRQSQIEMSSKSSDIL